MTDELDKGLKKTPTEDSKGIIGTERDIKEMNKTFDKWEKEQDDNKTN